MWVYPVTFCLFLFFVICDVFMMVFRGAREEHGERTSVRYILLVVHLFMLALQFVCLFLCICTTFWMEGLLVCKVLRFLKWYLPILGAHCLTTILLAVYGSHTSPLGIVGVIFLHLFDALISVMCFTSGMIAWAVLTEKSLYPPFSALRQASTRSKSKVNRGSSASQTPVPAPARASSRRPSLEAGTSFCSPQSSLRDHLAQGGPRQSVFQLPRRTGFGDLEDDPIDQSQSFLFRSIPQLDLMRPVSPLN